MFNTDIITVAKDGKDSAETVTETNITEHFLTSPSQRTQVMPFFASLGVVTAILNSIERYLCPAKGLVANHPVNKCINSSFLFSVLSR